MTAPADAAFARLDSWLRQGLQAVGPAERKRLMRGIARGLQARNQARITGQVAPDGAAWQARQPRRPGASSRYGGVAATAKMLIGLRAARRMAATADAGGAEIGFRGRTARIASVHHHGWVDAVAPGGPRARYPARALLGISASDQAWIRARVLDHLAAALR